MGNKFILGQEDGTVAGGNARGNGAVDLQMVGVLQLMLHQENIVL